MVCYDINRSVPLSPLTNPRNLMIKVMRIFFFLPTFVNKSVCECNKTGVFSVYYSY